MTGMPERIWANEIYDPDWRRIPDSVWDRDPWAGAAEYIRADIVAEKDAEIERLKKALDQVIEFCEVRLPTAFEADAWPKADLIIDKAACTANLKSLGVGKEAAAYLRERVASGDNRPPDSGVQSGVQHPEEGGKIA